MADFRYEEINVNPIGKPRMTRADKWKKRDVVLRYFDYKNQILEQSKKKNIHFKDGVLRARYIIAFPESYSKKKKEMLLGKPHRIKPDIDNITKGVQDSFLDNDSGIWKNVVEKVWGYEGKIIFAINDDISLE